MQCTTMDDLFTMEDNDEVFYTKNEDSTDGGFHDQEKQEQHLKRRRQVRDCFCLEIKYIGCDVVCFDYIQ